MGFVAGTMSRTAPQTPNVVPDPDSSTEHIKTAIDEDKLCFLLFAISLVGAVSCWSGALVMPDWIYWGERLSSPSSSSCIFASTATLNLLFRHHLAALGRASCKMYDLSEGCG